MCLVILREKYYIPRKDFTLKRILNFDRLIELLIVIGAGLLTKEILVAERGLKLIII